MSTLCILERFDRRRRARALGAVCLLGALAAGGVACEEVPPTGTARVAYTLTDPAGDPLTCEGAGVDVLSIELFTAMGDDAAASSATVSCEVSEDGEGRAVAEFPTGFFERSVVTMLDATGDAASQHTGEPARWEYLSVEIAGGVPTDYLPPAPGVFEADAQ